MFAGTQSCNRVRSPPLSVVCSLIGSCLVPNQYHTQIKKNLIPSFIGNRLRRGKIRLTKARWEKICFLAWNSLQGYSWQQPQQNSPSHSLEVEDDLGVAVWAHCIFPTASYYGIKPPATCPCLLKSWFTMHSLVFLRIPSQLTLRGRVQRTNLIFPLMLDWGLHSRVMTAHTWGYFKSMLCVIL